MEGIVTEVAGEADVVVDDAVDADGPVTQGGECAFDRCRVEAMEVGGCAGEGVGESGGEAGERAEGTEAAQAAEEWDAVDVFHHAPGASRCVGIEVEGVDLRSGVVLLGDAGLKGRLPGRGLWVGREAQHDPGGEIASAVGREVECPHLGPEPAAEWSRWPVEVEVWRVEALAEVGEHSVEFGGRLDW